MSAVPPNPIGSILQSHLTQRQASNVRDSDRNQRSNADTAQDKINTEKGSTVDATDDATKADPDAEGAGSQGRAFSEEPEEQDAEQPSEDEAEDQGHHIDFHV